MLPARYLKPIILVFHCFVRLDNYRAVVVAVNLRMFLGSLVYKEKYYTYMVSRRCVYSVGNLINLFF